MDRHWTEDRTDQLMVSPKWHFLSFPKLFVDHECVSIAHVPHAAMHAACMHSCLKFRVIVTVYRTYVDVVQYVLLR